MANDPIEWTQWIDKDGKPTAYFFQFILDLWRRGDGEDISLAQISAQVKQLLEAEGVEFPLTAFGDLRVAELHPQFQGSFEYTVDNTELTDNTETAGGTVTQASAMAVINTSTTTGSIAILHSHRHARYKSGLGGLARFTALFTSPVAATDQFVGLADERGSSTAFKNGYMVGYEGTTFGFHRFSNDALTTVAQANWDDPLDGSGQSGMTLDQTKLNVFFIQFQYLGGGSIQLFVEDDTTGAVVPVHMINYANQNIVPSTLNPNFRFTICADNKATTSNLTIKTSSYSYFVEGKTKFVELQQFIESSGLREKTSVQSEVAIFTIRNKVQYVSKTNFIDIIIEGVVGSIEANATNNLGSIRLVKNATLGGVPSYSDINATNSVVEIDTDSTTVSGGTEIIVLPLAGKNDSFHVNLKDHEIILNAGETITLAGLSVASATMDGAVLWKELF